jgi:hypothetical protein
MPEPESSVLRRFAGVNQQIEPVFLGPNYLLEARNWIPDTTFLLTKRPGSAAYYAFTSPVLTTTGMIRTYNASSRYLYGYGRDAAAAVDDRVWLVVDDVTPTAVTNGTFTGRKGATGRLIQYGTSIYAGNGVDPIKRIPIAGTAVDLGTVASFTDGSAAATVATDTGSSILTGTYSYAWCIYDHTNKVWLERGTTREITVRTSTDTNLSFPIPTGFATNAGALSSRYKAHLFISPVNYPVEFGHDHTTEGITASATIIRQILADGPAIPLRGVARTGSVFAVHRSRLWVTGEVANPTRVYATSVIIPGLEQAIFDAGLFFPANAVLTMPDNVTGLGIASVSENDDPQSPMAIFTLTRTFLFQGDILDDPSAQLVEVSSRVGCLGPDACTQTPFGLFFIALDSVYRIPPGGGIPEDVGWPIAPAIKAIPVGMRDDAQAFFHKGFLKLAFAPSGGSTNSTEYWLDLRNGGVGSTPSWWGPHTGGAPTAIAIGLQDTTEFDRAIAAIPSPAGNLVLLHQASQYGDATTTGTTTSITSTIKTGAIDHNDPFASKNYELIRVLGKAAGPTSIAVSMETDGGQTWQMDTPLVFTGGGSAVWGTALWDVDAWSAAMFEESVAYAPVTRPRGLSVSVTLIHTDRIRVDLRDFDIRRETVIRPKRSNAGGTPPAGA